MEANWYILVPVLVAIVAIVVLLIWRNQKDRVELKKTIIGEESALMPKEEDTEFDTTDEQ